MCKDSGFSTPTEKEKKYAPCTQVLVYRMKNQIVLVELWLGQPQWQRLGDWGSWLGSLSSEG